MSNVLFNKQETLNALKNIIARKGKPTDITYEDGVITFIVSDGSVVSYQFTTLYLKDRVVNMTEDDIFGIAGLEKEFYDGYITISVVDGVTKKQYLGDLTIDDFETLNVLSNGPENVVSKELEKKGYKFFLSELADLIKRELIRLNDKLSEVARIELSKYHSALLVNIANEVEV